MTYTLTGTSPPPSPAPTTTRRSASTPAPPRPPSWTVSDVATWVQLNHRSAAHLLTNGRALACGTHAGYGTLPTAHPATRRCQRCANTTPATTEEEASCA